MKKFQIWNNYYNRQKKKITTVIQLFENSDTKGGKQAQYGFDCEKEITSKEDIHFSVHIQFLRASSNTV